MIDTTKWRGKLEHRVGDRKEDPDMMGKEGYTEEFEGKRNSLEWRKSCSSRP
jgi:hypothetical protein